MTNIQNKKQQYFSPVITCIQLDVEISLAMESDPPSGEGETGQLNFDKNTMDPYRLNRV